MTSTETAPRKRAPRKTAKAIADEGPAGITSSTAAAMREQLEAATGEEVTAPAARRLRGGVTGYKITRPAGEPTPAERRDDDGRLISATTVVVDDVSHPDDPGPAEPIEAELDAMAGRDFTIDEVAPSPTPPPTVDDQVVDLERPAPAGEGGHPAGAPALPAGVIACGPGELTPADAATVTSYAADLERLAATRAAADARLRAAGPLGVAFADDMAEQLEAAGDVEVDVRQLVADVAAAVPFDFATLIAGHVGTAPDGTRVTVLDWPGVDNAPGPLDAAPGVQLPGEATPPAVDVEDVPPAVLSAELAAAIDEARDLEARAGELLEAAKAIKSQVQEAMGGEKGLATFAVDPNGVKLADWTRYTETRLDGTALKKADRATWDAYAKTSTRRRFTWAEQ